MKRTLLILAAFFTTVLTNTAASADCPPGTNWTAAWSDAYGQTTYTLEAPCKVYIGIPFTITATVNDATYANDNVGFGWAIKDNGSTILGGGFNWITTASGQWQQVIEQTYTGTPIDHLIEFQFTDLGGGGSAHWWASKLIGNVTVDPYPPAANMPPVVDAGPDVFIESKDRASTVINGTASDVDGNSLTYRWLEGAVELQAFRPVDASGNAPLDLAGIALGIGSHTLALEVSDGTAVASDTVVVSLENSRPVAAPAPGGTFQAGQDIALNGTVADYDGDLLTYQWLEGTSVLAQGRLASTAGGAPVTLPEQVLSGGLPMGSHNLVLEVNDGINTVTEPIQVNVIDTLAPTLAPVPSTGILWPPDGRMTEVTIKANAYDNSGGPVMLSVLVTTNETLRKDRRHTPIPDYSVASIDQASGTVVLELRNLPPRERELPLYTVTITAVDASGNSSSAEVRIKTAHDRSAARQGALSSRGLKGQYQPPRKPGKQ